MPERFCRASRPTEIAGFPPKACGNDASRKKRSLCPRAVYISNDVSVIEDGPGYASAPAAGSTIDVGRVEVGLPVTATLTISETGVATLTVTSYSLSGANAADFSVSPATLSIPDGGAAQSLSIRCTPGGPGLRTATLTVNHNAADSPAMYTLNCTGLAAVYLPMVLRLE